MKLAEACGYSHEDGYEPEDPHDRNRYWCVKPLGHQDRKHHDGNGRSWWYPTVAEYVNEWIHEQAIPKNWLIRDIAQLG